MRLNSITKLFLLTGLLLVLSFSTSFASENIDNWLITSPVLLPHSPIGDDADAKPIDDILGNPPVNVNNFWPSTGTKIQLTPAGLSEMKAANLDFTTLYEVTPEGVHMALAASYVTCPVWQKVTFEVSGRAPFVLYVDGEEVCKQAVVAESDTNKVTGEYTLDQGFHRVIMITAICGKDEVDGDWKFDVAINRGEEAKAEWACTSSTDPRHPFDITDYYMVEGVGGVNVSPDGRYVTAKFSRWNEEADKQESRLEVWDIKKKEMVWNYYNPKGVSNLSWSHDGTKLLFTSANKFDGTDVYVWDLYDKILKRVVDGITDSYGFSWANDDKGLYYTKTVAWEDNGKPYKAMWGLNDRWAGYRDDTEIYYYGFEGNTTIKLTTGKWDANGILVSTDGKTIFMQRGVPMDVRPFGMAEIWAINTTNGDAKKIYEMPVGDWGLSQLTVNPEGTKLAFLAPKDETEPLGVNTHPDHNDNASDLWILDIASGEVKNVTREFEPAICAGSYVTHRGGFMFWHDNGQILFTALHKKIVSLFSYDLNKDVITEYKLPEPENGNYESIAVGGSDLSASHNSTMLVYRSDILEGQGDLFYYDWKRKKGGELIDFNKKFDTLIGPAPRIVDYNYTNSDGIQIDGFLFYPKDYDANKKYPMVVDFYGGVFGFAGGFYWGSTVFANRGYFVYIPTPRGAAGWGQEFADDHVNDWGTKVSRDMNEGVRHIVANVPGVDGTKVAPVSGSYGGFMSMYLLSQPKDHKDFYPYSTAISDYGISNLASYWGIGWWGYLYSDMATARKYPWNDKQYYIDHSPLFWADNITVPLLLVHGDADNNVPVGESDQMYTALKVLGREVEFVRFPGEDHGIVGKRSSYLTSKRMHFEWFDKYMRDLPGAWDERMKDEHR